MRDRTPHAVEFVRGRGVGRHVPTALVAVLAAGCGRSERETSGGAGAETAVDLRAPWQSGVRLRARVLDGGDGAVHFLGWQDTELGIPCAFATTSGSGIRCLPTASALTLFSDADCMDPVHAMMAEEASAGSYVALPSADSECGTLPPGEAGVVGELLSGPVLYDRVDAGARKVCLSIDATLLRSVEPAAASQFVGAKVHVHAADANIGVVVVVAADGARENPTFFDVGRNTPCEVLAQHVEGASLVCIPSTARGINTIFFGDAACSNRFAATSGSCDSDLGVRLLPSTCHSSPTRAIELEELAPATAVPPPWYAQAGTCGSYEPSDAVGWTTQPALGVLTPAAFPSVTTYALGSGRLQSHLYATSDGVVVRETFLNFSLEERRTPHRFSDTSLGVDCTRRETSDGVARCLPRGPCPTPGLFLDAACTNSGVQVDLDPACSPPGYVIAPCVADERAASIDALGAPQPNAYSFNAGLCVDGTERLGGAGLASRIPAAFTDFVELVERVE